MHDWLLDTFRRSLFSATDIPVLEYSHSRATVFGLNWSTFFTLKGIEPKDVWTSDIGAHSLMTARLFPLAVDVDSWRDLLWLQDIEGATVSRLESWRLSKRYSMDDFNRLSDPVAALHNLRMINSSVFLKSIPRWPGSLSTYFRRACAGIALLIIILTLHSISSVIFKTNKVVVHFPFRKLE